MSLINYFDRDWLDYKPLFEKDNSQYAQLYVNLNQSFFNNLKFDKNSCKEYRINAAKKSIETLGNNVALCISGGVDSQAMLHSYIEAGLSFTAYTFVFNDDLNLFDTNYAREYCKSHHVDLIEIPFDIISFLNRENYDYGINYCSPSPHFNAHYKFCDILREKGHTGICFGGTTPYQNKSGWGQNFNYNTFNFITYSEKNQYPVQGSFLSYYPELTWATALLTPLTDIAVNGETNPPLLELQRAEAVRYANKIYGYNKVGFDILESKKYTGFENVKDYYKNLTNNGYEFENRFRKPLEINFSANLKLPKFIFKEGVLELLSSIRSNN